jgi:hypothetical protein
MGIGKFGGQINQTEYVLRDEVSEAKSGIIPGNY